MIGAMHHLAIYLFTAVVIVTGVTLPVQAQDDVVTVRIFDEPSPSSIMVSAPGSDLDVFAGDFDQPIGTIARGSEAPLSQSGSQLSIVVDGMRLFAEELRIRGASSLLVKHDAGGAPTERLLPGELRVRAGSGSRLVIQNTLDVEAYVASVVAHEYGFEDVEGARAMAVVARTYALNQMLSDTPLVDHVGSQVYGDERRVTDSAYRAAQSTRGEVLTFGGELIEAVYSSSSGGTTANNEDVWDAAPIPYLRSRNDPFDRDSPHGNWTWRVNRDQLLRALSRDTGVTVSGFISGDRGPDGRVRVVELLSTSGPRNEISTDRFRRILRNEFGVGSLKSTNFDARRDGNEYVFEGSGFGHGVGLNQHGARFLAQEGYAYRDILGFYYSGVNLTTHRNGHPVGAGDALIPDTRLLADAGETPPHSDRLRDRSIAGDSPPAPVRESGNVREEDAEVAAPPVRRTSTSRTSTRIGW